MNATFLGPSLKVVGLFDQLAAPVQCKNTVILSVVLGLREALIPNGEHAGMDFDDKLLKVPFVKVLQEVWLKIMWV